MRARLGLESSFSLEIEGESLVGTSQVTGGRTSAQQLVGLPDTWSGDYQLWWTGAAPGNTCKLLLYDISPGARTITLHMTQARDYATCRISVRNLFKELDFYSRSVQLSDPIEFANVTVDPGVPLEITFQVIGKNPEADPGYFVGLYRIEVK